MKRKNGKLLAENDVLRDERGALEEELKISRGELEMLKERDQSPQDEVAKIQALLDAATVTIKEQSEKIEKIQGDVDSKQQSTAPPAGMWGVLVLTSIPITFHVLDMFRA